MSDLVGNPDDRFSQNEAQIRPVAAYTRYNVCAADALLLLQIISGVVWRFC